MPEPEDDTAALEPAIDPQFTPEEMEQHKGKPPIEYNKIEPVKAPTPYINTPSATPDDSPGSLLAVAVARGANVDELDRLLALKERVDKETARKAYTAAMAQFKSNAPEIFKDKDVEFGSGSSLTSYSHATLGQVANVIASALGQYGLSHNWTMQQDQGLITVRCTITHEQGHSESAQLAAGADESGSKNVIQAVASTVTYLERYTLLAITGMAAQEGDDDARLAGSTLIDDEQLAQLNDIIEQLGEGFLSKAFLNAMGKLEALELMPAKRFPQALKVLEQKLARNRS